MYRWNFAGGNEPRLVAAATAQLNTLPFYHSFWNRSTKPSLVVFFFFSLLHFCSDRRNDSFHYPFRLSFTSSSIYSLWLFHVALCFFASLIMSVLS